MSYITFKVDAIRQVGEGVDNCAKKLFHKQTQKFIVLVSRDNKPQREYSRIESHHPSITMYYAMGGPLWPQCY